LGDRLAAPFAEGLFNRRGVVQLAPVPAGLYTLEVSAPGRAMSRLAGITVYDRSESQLRTPIRLDPPLQIQLALDPARDPTGAAWRVTVDRANPMTFRPTREADGVASDGVFAFTGAAGNYVVAVKDRNENIYAERHFDVHSAVDALQTIAIPLLHLRGTVTLAKHPVSARLTFGGRNGSERVGATANDEGDFTISLPHSGRWSVDVERKEDGVLTSVTTTVNEKQDELQIDLPDTVIGGWVTDPEGQRVADAVVSLSTSAGTVNNRTSVDGTFSFRGIPPGTANIVAVDNHQGEHSDYVSVPIIDGLHRSDINLALRNMNVVKGTISSEGQRVVGARVTGYGFSTGMARQERTVSGLDGGFELSIPDSATQIVLIVSAPGRSLQAFATPTADKPLTLDVASAGGLLRLRMPHNSTGPRVTYNGIPLPMPDLLQWAQAQEQQAKGNDTFVFADLAPGAYRFCVFDKGKDVCRDGILSRGGVLSLGTD
jgi:hypothetical protein